MNWRRNWTHPEVSLRIWVRVRSVLVESCDVFSTSCTTWQEPVVLFDSKFTFEKHFHLTSSSVAEKIGLL